jgi:hypothetical protein
MKLIQSHTSYNRCNIIIHTLQIVRDNNSYESSSLELQKLGLDNFESREYICKLKPLVSNLGNI